ncbi:hypothetical protein E1193_23385 [Micromonospora sp. KC606]|nr:hypothetical protein E1193_23385 [Micromonospora sp. KC606]
MGRHPAGSRPAGCATARRPGRCTRTPSRSCRRSRRTRGRGSRHAGRPGPRSTDPSGLAGRPVRNWDYRYTWHRDAALLLLALFRLGHAEEGSRYLHFLLLRANRAGGVAGADGEEIVPDRDSARGTVPALQHQRPRQVPPVGFGAPRHRPRPRAAAPAVEQAGEDRVALEVRDAAPLDRPVRPDQRRGVRVGEEGVPVDRWNAHVSSGRTWPPNTSRNRC